MGYEIAGGLGIKMADPTRDVYVLVGDGSYLMLAQEIITSIQENYKLIIVLINNDGHSSIGGLSQATGAQGFATRFRYRDDNTGELKGIFYPLTLQRKSLGANVIEATTTQSLKAAYKKLGKLTEQPSSRLMSIMT